MENSVLLRQSHYCSGSKPSLAQEVYHGSQNEAFTTPLGSQAINWRTLIQSRLQKGMNHTLPHCVRITYQKYLSVCWLLHMTISHICFCSMTCTQRPRAGPQQKSDVNHLSTATSSDDLQDTTHLTATELLCLLTSPLTQLSSSNPSCPVPLPVIK